MDPNTTAVAEGQRWLSIAVKLLMGRDLVGSKTFAIRARESDPRLEFADQILAVVDTLLAGDKRINNQPDWYAILQLIRGPHHETEVIAAQYRRLALLLNPHRNKLPFADQAFKLVTDAWSVLSNPSRKSLYDNELNFQPVVNLFGSTYEQQPFLYKPSQPSLNLNPFAINREQQPSQPVVVNPFRLNRQEQIFNPFGPPLPQPQPQPQQQPQPQPQPPPSNIVEEEVVEERQVNDDTHGNSDESSSFWTACPYCYNMYEYPNVYAECTLRCQNCRRAFHAVKVQSPPIVEGKESYFCCWAFFPVGVSEDKQKNKGGDSGWSPFSSMVAVPKDASNGGQKKGPKKPRPRRSSAPWVYIDDQEEDIFRGISETSNSSDDDWRRSRRRKKVKSARRKRSVRRNVKQSQGDKAKNVKVGVSRENLRGGSSTQEGVGVPNMPVAETSKKAVSHNTRRQSGRAARELGKLDLNVEFSNEVEEPALGMNEGNGTGNREEDNIEGIGFFEGLDEFLSSLPILSVVGDDKVKPT